MGGEVVSTADLREGQALTVTNPLISRLRMRRSAAVIAPATFAVSQNYPNPFNPVTDIRYVIPEAGRVNVAVFNALGQRVRTLVDAIQPAGQQTVRWDSRDDVGRNVASGVYVYRVTSGTHSATKKMILMR